MEGAVDARFARVLRDTPSDELLGYAEDVRSLLEHPGWRFVQELVEKAKGQILDGLVLGPARDKAEQYAKDLGVVNGAGLARAAAEAVLLVAEEKRRMVEERAEARV